MTNIEQMSRQFRLLTDWHLSVLDGIRPADGSRVLSDHTNSLEWLAGHLLVTRNRNIARLGGPAQELPDLDAYVDSALPPPNFRPFDKHRVYPSLAACAEAWGKVSTVFLATLLAADERTRQTVLPLSGPTGGNTVEDLLVAAVLHESFHIGQMSILRKAFGYPAMYWFARPLTA
ncbi:MAG: DinB family protein [Janthinobacterium lividum]